MIKLDKEFFYRIQIGDTEQELIRRFNTSKENILRNDNTTPLYAGEWVKIVVNDYITHIVSPMETIEKIANKYNTTVEKLIETNALHSNRLFIGQCIKIYNN